MTFFIQYTIYSLQNDSITESTLNESISAILSNEPNAVSTDQLRVKRKSNNCWFGITQLKEQACTFSDEWMIIQVMLKLSKEYNNQIVIQVEDQDGSPFLMQSLRNYNDQRQTSEDLDSEKMHTTENRQTTQNTDFLLTDNVQYDKVQNDNVQNDEGMCLVQLYKEYKRHGIPFKNRIFIFNGTVCFVDSRTAKTNENIPVRMTLKDMLMALSHCVSKNQYNPLEHEGILYHLRCNLFDNVLNEEQWTEFNNAGQLECKKQSNTNHRISNSSSNDDSSSSSDYSFTDESSTDSSTDTGDTNDTSDTNDTNDTSNTSNILDKDGTVNELLSKGIINEDEFEVIEAMLADPDLLYKLMTLNDNEQQVLGTQEILDKIRCLKELLKEQQPLNHPNDDTKDCHTTEEEDDDIDWSEEYSPESVTEHLEKLLKLTQADIHDSR